MKNEAYELLNEFQYILGICPCCGEIFRLSECRLLTPAFKPENGDPFSKLQEELRKMEAMEAHIECETEKLGLYEEDVNKKLAVSKKDAREAGRKEAKLRLKKIDPLFSGKDIDPQDVRVLFHPVEYIVFSNMNGSGLDKIELVSREPLDATEERTCTSIDRTVKKGNIEFQVINVGEDGRLAFGTGDDKSNGTSKKGKASSVTITVMETNPGENL